MKEENKKLRLELAQMKGQVLKASSFKEQSMLMNSSQISYLGRDKGL
jgi:hypothetical protein